MPTPKEKTAAPPPIPPKEPSATLAIPPGPVPEESVEQALFRAEQRIRYRQGILKLIAASVEPNDVLIYGDPPNEHPYFTEHACRFILNAAGIKLSDPIMVPQRYDGKEGPYIDFEYWATILTSDGRFVRTMGNCATEDDFYSKRFRWICPDCKALTHYAKPKPRCSACGPVDAIKEAFHLPLTEVDVPSVKKKAMTNLWNQALRDLALMPSLDELKKAGMDTNKLKRVRFGDAKDSGAAPERSGAAEPTRKAPTAAPQTQTGVTSGTGGEKTASSPTKHNTSEGNPTPRPSQPAPPPKAVLPKRIESVRAAVAQNGDAKGNIYLRIVQAGQTLFCFDNRKMGEDERLFDILKDSEGQDAQLLVAEQTRKSDGKKFLAVVGALKIGDREWGTDGFPILRRERYQSEDADLPF